MTKKAVACWLQSNIDPARQKLLGSKGVVFALFLSVRLADLNAAKRYPMLTHLVQRK